MEQINYMTIYVDNSCECHLINDNSKLILSPCGSEFMHFTYDDSMTSSKQASFLTSKINNNILHK